MINSALTLEEWILGLIQCRRRVHPLHSFWRFATIQSNSIRLQLTCTAINEEVSLWIAGYNFEVNPLCRVHVVVVAH